MKKIILLTIVSGLLLGCQGGDKKATDTAGATGAVSKTDVSYAFGMAVGTSIKETSVAIDYDSFMTGFKDVVEKNAPKYPMNDAQTMIQKAITDAKAKQAEENVAKEKAYMDSNKTKSGIKSTPSGLQYEVIKEGNGPKPTATDTVKVDYVGKLIDGTTFDSSIERKQPATFPLNGVIPGWTEGIQLMSVGSKYKFTIPSALAYGAQGAGAKIPPNSVLIFEVDLISIEKTPEPAMQPPQPGK